MAEDSDLDDDLMLLAGRADNNSGACKKRRAEQLHESEDANDAKEWRAKLKAAKEMPFKKRMAAKEVRCPASACCLSAQNST